MKLNTNALSKRYTNIQNERLQTVFLTLGRATSGHKNASRHSLCLKINSVSHNTKWKWKQ